MANLPYQTIRYPESRIGTLDVGRIALSKHHVAGLLEIDVTEALAAIRRHRTDRSRISFFSWMVKSISMALAENRLAHGVHAGKTSVAVFDDVDISVMVEKVVHGKRVPLPVLIRKSNEKTIADIHAEILSAQNADITDESDYVMSDSGPSRWAMRFYYFLPQSLRLFMMKLLLKNPTRSKAMMGTAIVTSVGFSSNLSGWILPKSIHNSCFALGSVTKKPWVVSNRVEIRDILHMTVLVNHDIIDGIPAALFISGLIDRMKRRVDLDGD